jgi:anti-sigma factor RsiW
MRCNEFDDLASLYLSEELDRARRREFDQHVAGCSTCASLLERQMRADDLLRLSLATLPVPTGAVRSRVSARIRAVPWWRQIFQTRRFQFALASALLVIAIISFLGSRSDPRALYLFETAAADHLECVVQNIEKTGWLTDVGATEQLAIQIVGDARPVRGLAPAGYTLVKARPCHLEGKAKIWLHLIYSRGASEVSFFVRSSRISPESTGQLALTANLSSRRVGDLEVVGFQRGAYGIIFVADVSRHEALRLAGAAADWIS